MPDYNPAVASGIQPPQPLNWAGTLGTVANIQAEQARTNLYTLQGLQQQRQYSGLMAAAEAFRTGRDPVAAAAPYGLDPTMLNAFQTLKQNQTFAGAHGGLSTQGAEANANIARAGAETALTRAKIPGAEAESDVSRKADAAAAANSYFASGDRSAVIAHAQKYNDNPLGVQTLANLPKEQFDRVAASALGGGLTAAQATEPVKGETPEGAPLTTTRMGFVTGVPMVGQSEEAKARAGKQGAYFSNLYSGIAATGNTAANARDEINIAKSVINDPQFYSGTAEGANLAYKRALASFGVDPGASLPQEAFRKIMSANILQQVNGLRAAQEEMGAAGGRIFQSQIEMMEKAAQNPDNSVAANRFLTELADRASQRNMKIADMAANYKGGKLDPVFEKQLRDYTNKNPLFSDQELKFPKLIGMDPKERQYLKDHPNTAPIFDKHYGSGASQAIIGQ